MIKAVGLMKNHRQVCWKLGLYDGASKRHLGIIFSPGQVSMSCGASLYRPSKVTKLVYEEDTKYVALEVDSSKSGWPTLYEILQIVLFQVSPCMYYYILYLLLSINMMSQDIY